MVLPLGPGKFYGSSLPRPRIYTDLKFNSERVDPPMGVTAPLMVWAKDALWSMGGISHQRKRMQGKIEGNLKKLREEEESEARKKIRAEKRKMLEEDNGSALAEGDVGETPKVSAGKSALVERGTPVEAQVVKQAWADLEDEECPTVVPESDLKSGGKRSPPVRRRIRKLSEAFNEQAGALDSPNGVALRRGLEDPVDHFVTRSALKVQAAKEMGASDCVAVPDKAMRASPQKQKKSEKDVAGVELAPLGSSNGSVRRSSRLSGSTPVAPTKRSRRLVLSP